MIKRLVFGLCCVLWAVTCYAQTTGQRPSPLGPGLASTPNVYNPGTQLPLPDQPIYLQLFYEAHATSCTINSSCGSANDSGKLLTATAAGVTFTLPAPGAPGTTGYIFGYDGSHAYTLTTAGGTVYGCGAAGPSIVLSIPVSLSPDGTNWQCAPLGTQEAAAALGGGSCTGAITAALSPSVTYFYCTSTGATTWTVSNSAAAGIVSSFSLELTNGGAFAQTWMSGTKWPGGAAPTLTASGVDVIVCSTRDAGTTWRCVLAEKGSA
jgi:hypothetical protein